MQSDSTQQTGGKKGIYVAATAAVLAFILTIAFVVDLAGREANRTALASELSMVRLEFDRQRELADREQAEISFWDKGVRELVKKPLPDPGFVEDELVEWLAGDFRFSRIVVTERDLKPVLSVIDGDYNPAPQKSPLVEKSGDLAAQALRRFKEKRLGSPAGYWIEAPEGDMTSGIMAAGFRMIAGVPGLVTVQVIVPESVEFSIRDSEVRLLFGFKPLDGKSVATTGLRLGLPMPLIVPVAADPGTPARVLLPDDASAGSLVFLWQPVGPRGEIVAKTTPVALLLVLLVSLVIGYFVRDHARAMSALALSESRNRHLASHDPLTGVANRAQLDAAIEGVLSDPYATPFAVICIDLDRFKPVNDTHGHHAGDAVLTSVARRFETVIADKGMIARIGGDEFIALVLEGTGDEQLEWLADSMVEAASLPVPWEGMRISIGASAGIAVWPRDGRSKRELIAAADAALYEGKRQGRGRVVLAKAPPLDPGDALLAG